MKIFYYIIFATVCFADASAQQENSGQQAILREQQFENLAEELNGEPEDDSYLQALSHFRIYKLNLNTATNSELKELHLVSELQITNLITYKKLLGNLLSLYELQSVPGWDLETIQKILPYVKVDNTNESLLSLKQRVSQGQHSLLLRWQQILEKSNGYLRPDNAPIRYLGSPHKLLFRYKYVFRNLLQFGITGEKDAGEQFFKGAHKHGFDFYSMHLFARKLGPVRFLAVGDFTVNLGQGLIHWQSLAFNKSAEVTGVKRQADILRPYNSPGEYNFMRGAGVTVGTKNIEVTLFSSSRRIDGRLLSDTFQNTNEYIASIQNTGYHRTATEVSKKNMVTQNSFGGNLSLNKNNFHVGINAVTFSFSNALNQNVLPYNQYLVKGDKWSNYSVDYAYTFRNMHFFGEVAMDKSTAKAFLGGLLASLDAKVDVSLLYRNIDQRYQALYGNAFTENTMPTNEKGLFTGLSVRPNVRYKIDAYADVFSFPWLKYRVDAPSNGSGYLIQFTYNPRKQVEIYMRFKDDRKPGNMPTTDFATREVFQRPKVSWRTQINYDLSKSFTLNQRVELLWFDRHEITRSQQGYLLYVEGKYKPLSKPYAINGRVQYFNIDGFESRIYAYESDLLYSFSIPQFIGKGLRYYVNARYNVNSKITLWGRCAQTLYSSVSSIGSGLDKIDGSRKSEVKLQILWNL